MAEIVNLRQARKQKARAEKEARAEQNRVTFGRGKAEKELTKAERELARRHIDSHKRDDHEKS
ncbi:MAG TPA: DUF4169 family protein [Microvirga sp.]|nr:DUF4169 family protein [Microvirga sp.]